MSLGALSDCEGQELPHHGQWDMAAGSASCLHIQRIPAPPALQQGWMEETPGRAGGTLSTRLRGGTVQGD